MITSPFHLYSRSSNQSHLFQVNLGQLHSVKGVATQGRHDADQWVTSFSLAYTADDFNFVYIRENSQVKVFIEKARVLKITFL